MIKALKPLYAAMFAVTFGVWIYVVLHPDNKVTIPQHLFGCYKGDEYVSKEMLKLIPPSVIVTPDFRVSTSAFQGKNGIYLIPDKKIAIKAVPGNPLSLSTGLPLMINFQNNLNAFEILDKAGPVVVFSKTPCP